MLYLNNADREVVESFTGELPLKNTCPFFLQPFGTVRSDFTEASSKVIINCTWLLIIQFKKLHPKHSYTYC